jgi:hypothetical protein
MAENGEIVMSASNRRFCFHARDKGASKRVNGQVRSYVIALAALAAAVIARLAVDPIAHNKVRFYSSLSPS